jgi:hypothetical protein
VWTRAELKERAKAVLRLSYWKAFLISLVLAFLGGGTSGSGAGSRMKASDWEQFKNFGSFTPTELSTIFAIAGGLTLVFVIIGLAIWILAGIPVEVGGRRYFVQAAQGSVDLNHLGFSFKADRYIDIIKAMLWRWLFNTLWYFLFIIPGIVKSYAYLMVPYILSDNPNIGYRRALELSRKMTYGHKADIFILDLSFIGWYLLGVLACCVGVFFLLPYINSTKAELYLVLRSNALATGLCTADELMLPVAA